MNNFGSNVVFVLYVNVHVFECCVRACVCACACVCECGSCVLMCACTVCFCLLMFKLNTHMQSKACTLTACMPAVAYGHT